MDVPKQSYFDDSQYVIKIVLSFIFFADVEYSNTTLHNRIKRQENFILNKIVIPFIASNYNVYNFHFCFYNLLWLYHFNDYNIQKKMRNSQGDFTFRMCLLRLIYIGIIR